MKTVLITLGLVSFAILLSGCGNTLPKNEAEQFIAKNKSYCTDQPTQDKKGKNVFPIIPLYEKMPILGQLFTASYCNDERMATIAEITDGQYTAGSIIWLQDNPPEEMITILHDIGYTCSGGTEGTCTKWRLAETSIDPQKILQLRSFSQKITDDACVYCK